MKYQTAAFLRASEIPIEDLGGGFKRQMLGYNDEMMMARIMCDAGAIGSVHQHPHTQTTFIIEGEFEVEIDGETSRLGAGDSFFVAPDLKHGLRCLEAGVILDVFSPIREDFLN